MTSPANQVNNFRRVFDEIKSYVRNNPAMSKEDCEKISELLRVLKFVIQHDILERCFDENAVLSSVVADIDTKLNIIESERQALLESKNRENLMRLIALRKSSEELKTIKKSIRDKDFSFYIHEMASGLKSSNELIIACASVLGSGREEYLSMFGRDLVKGTTINEQGINLLFNIITTDNIKNRLQSYLRNEGGYQALKQERDENNKFIEYLLLAKKHEVLLREYLTLLSHDKIINEDDYIKAKAIVARDELELHNIPATGIAGVLNRKKRELLEFELERAQKSVTEHEQAKSRVAELKEILTNFGLGAILEIYFNGNMNPSTVEERVVSYIKTSMNRNFFSINGVVEKVKERNREIVSLLSSAMFEIERDKNALGEKEREYIILNHDEVVKILEILNSKDKGGLSQILAAYILKAISDVKHLDPEDILDICAVNVDTSELSERYSRQYEVEARNIQDRLLDMELEERTKMGGYH